MTPQDVAQSAAYGFGMSLPGLVVWTIAALCAAFLVQKRPWVAGLLVAGAASAWFTAVAGTAADAWFYWKLSTTTSIDGWEWVFRASGVAWTLFEVLTWIGVLAAVFGWRGEDEPESDATDAAGASPSGSA